ncbi:MAG: hypothetical protein Fur0021_29750 [Candidatus Promineifilaceae bacterium]
MGAQRAFLRFFAFIVVLFAVSELHLRFPVICSSEKGIYGTDNSIQHGANGGADPLL